MAAKKKPARAERPARYRIARQVTTTSGPGGLPTTDGRGLERVITEHFEPADPDDPDALDAEALMQHTQEHPLDVLERVARCDLEALGFEPPASFLDNTPPEIRATLGREMKKKLDREIRTRLAAGKSVELFSDEIAAICGGFTDEARRRMRLLELARENERTPKVLAARTLVSVLLAKRQLARGEALAGCAGAEAASQLRSALADTARHAVFAAWTWQSARYRPLERHYWEGKTVADTRARDPSNGGRRREETFAKPRREQIVRAVDEARTSRRLSDVEARRFVANRTKLSLSQVSRICRKARHPR